MRDRTFVAIDFETANQARDSACSVGLVRVENGSIINKKVFLIRPPTRQFLFTHIHGITWAQVAESPTFEDVWSQIVEFSQGIHFYAAHNSSFDEGVLRSCCLRYGIEPPPVPFICTVQLARSHWKLFPTKLPDVCRHLGISLNHHEALSDAEACAKIVIAALTGTSVSASPTVKF